MFHNSKSNKRKLNAVRDNDQLDTTKSSIHGDGQDYMIIGSSAVYQPTDSGIANSATSLPEIVHDDSILQPPPPRKRQRKQPAELTTSNVGHTPVHLDPPQKTQDFITTDTSPHTHTQTTPSIIVQHRVVSTPQPIRQRSSNDMVWVTDKEGRIRLLTTEEIGKLESEPAIKNLAWSITYGAYQKQLRDETIAGWAPNEPRSSETRGLQDELHEEQTQRLITLLVAQSSAAGRLQDELHEEQSKNQRLTTLLAEKSSETDKQKEELHYEKSSETDKLKEELHYEQSKSLRLTKLLSEKSSETDKLKEQLQEEQFKNLRLTKLLSEQSFSNQQLVAYNAKLTEELVTHRSYIRCLETAFLAHQKFIRSIPAIQPMSQPSAPRSPKSISSINSALRDPTITSMRPIPLSMLFPHQAIQTQHTTPPSPVPNNQLPEEDEMLAGLLQPQPADTEQSATQEEPTNPHHAASVRHTLFAPSSPLPESLFTSLDTDLIALLRSNGWNP